MQSPKNRQRQLLRPRQRNLPLFRQPRRTPLLLQQRPREECASASFRRRRKARSASAFTMGMERSCAVCISKPNPLANDKRSIIDLGVGFDSDGSYLKTIDDLPLFMLSETPNLIRAFITKKSEKSVDVWQDNGTSVHQFRISNVDKMMAFDCGEFELK